jgi:hypothetical protein
MDDGLLDKFNETFINLIEDLNTALGGDAELEAYKLIVQGFVYANRSGVFNIFHKHVTQRFEQEIMARDSSFFLLHEFSNVTPKVSQIILKLKGCWHLLNEENRSVVWRYFRVLILLDKKIFKDIADT